MDAVIPVLVLFFLMLIGFFCARIKVTGPEMAGYFSSFLVKVSLPCLLFTSFQRPFSQELLREAGWTVCLSVLIYGLSFLVAFVYPRILGMKGIERGVHRYALIISNCGYIGYPVIGAILGPDYLFHAVIFNLPFSILAFSLCAWLISKEKDHSTRLSWKNFVNINVIATVLGILCFVLSLRLPGPVYQALKMTGDMTSPLSMIMIGTTLAQADVRQVFGRWQVYVTVVTRLFLLPLLAGLLYYFLGFRGSLFLLGVVITAMPVGSSVSILASLYRIAPEEASSLVFLSTTLCMFTIPLVTLAAKHFM